MPESFKTPRVIAICCALTLGTLLIFWQVHRFGFVSYDDNVYVFENPHIQNGFTLASVKWALTTGYFGNWNPMTWFSYMLDWKLFGSDAEGFHLTNLLLHIANSLLVFIVFKQMTKAIWQSALVAALFALHPLHVEAVVWVSGRKDVLSTFFWLLTILAYVRYVKQPGVPAYLMILCAFVAGIMAKPMLVTLPLVLLLLDYWPLDRVHGFHWKQLSGLVVEKLPLMTLAVIFGVIAFFTQRNAGAIVELVPASLGSRICTVFVSYVQYIWMMLWPGRLATPYPPPYEGAPVLAVVASAAILIAVTVLVIRLSKGHRYLVTGWFWYIVTLLPVIGIVRLSSHVIADRYTYVTLTGLFVIIAWGLPELLAGWPYRRLALGTSAAVVLVALGMIAHRQTSFWNDSMTLFSHAIEVTQDNYLAYNNRGIEYSKLAHWQEAMEDFDRAISINPGYDKPHNNIGIVYGTLGRWQDAIDAFKHAIETNPHYAEAYTNLGTVYGRLGRWQDAIDAHKQAITVQPDFAQAHYNLGIAYAGAGQWRAAMEAYRQAIRIRPDWFAPMNDLAFLIATHPQLKDRDPNEAIGLATRACRLTDNRNPAVLDTLAAAYASAARFAEAIDTAEKALAIANAAGQQQVAQQIQLHLSFYTQGKPFAEAAAQTP